jgi:predicted transcriptional regulator
VAPPVPGLGPLESAIMTAVWNAAEPLTGRDVYRHLDYRGDAGDIPTYTTVATVLAILWRKGLLERAACLPGTGGRWVWSYQGKVSRESYLAVVVRSALDCTPNRTLVLGLALAAPGDDWTQRLGVAT